MPLTRFQAADRAAVRDARRGVLSEEPPSMARLADWSSRSAETRDGFHVVPADHGGPTLGTAEYACGAHLARFGQQDNAFRAAPPTSVEQLRKVLGGSMITDDEIRDLVARLMKAQAAHDPITEIERLPLGWLRPEPVEPRRSAYGLTASGVTTATPRPALR
jgi:hypothetical protein